MWSWQAPAASRSPCWRRQQQTSGLKKFRCIRSSCRLSPPRRCVLFTAPNVMTIHLGLKLIDEAMSGHRILATFSVCLTSDTPQDAASLLIWTKSYCKGSSIVKHPSNHSFNRRCPSPGHLSDAVDAFLCVAVHHCIWLSSRRSVWLPKRETPYINEKICLLHAASTNSSQGITTFGQYWTRTECLKIQAVAISSCVKSGKDMADRLTRPHLDGAASGDLGFTGKLPYCCIGITSFGKVASVTVVHFF